MRVAEYKQISETIEIIHHEAEYDDEGNIIQEAYEEEIKHPVMGTVYRDATPEEEAQAEEARKLTEEIEEPTTIEDLVEAIDILTEIVLGESEAEE